MPWSLNNLIKQPLLTYIPGSPYVPADPGQPYKPYYCETTFKTIKVWNSLSVWDDKNDDGIKTSDEIETVWYTTDKTVAEKTCYDEQPYIAPTPAQAAVPSQTLIDYQFGWNASALGASRLATPGSFSFQVGVSSIGVACGLTNIFTTQSSHYVDMELCFLCQKGKYTVLNHGAVLTPLTDFTDGDVFSIESVSGRLVAKVNDVPVADIAAQGTIYEADASLYAAYDTIFDAAYSAVTPVTLEMETESSTGFTGAVGDSTSFGTETITLAGANGLTVDNDTFARFETDTNTEASYSYVLEVKTRLETNTETSSSYTAEVPVTAGANITFEPVDVHSADGVYGYGEVTLPTVEVSSEQGFIEPKYAVANIGLPYLTMFARSLTSGGTTGSDVQIAPMKITSSDQAYAGVDIVIEPIQALSFEAIDVNVLEGVVPGFTMNAFMSRADQNALQGKVPVPTIEAQTGAQLVAVAPGFSITATADFPNYARLEEAIGYA